MPTDDGPLFERLRQKAVQAIAPKLRLENSADGLYLPLLDLHLDPQNSVKRAFISHAHADHGAAMRVSPDPGAAIPELRLASPETAALLKARYGETHPIRVIGWNETFELGPARVRIAPAGHILGAAALVVESDDGTLVYTGDVKPGAGLTHRAAELPACDVLVIESTFGLPIFSFPSDAANHDAMLAFARESIADGKTPVFLAYALGKGQEIAQLLGSNGIAVRAHGAMTKLNEVYREHGIALPNVRPYDKDDKEGPAALIVPPRDRFGAMFKKGRNAGIRVAFVSGWALLDSSRERYDADAQIPLSDHASFAELDCLVERCRPKRVIVTHGYAQSYARYLRKRGMHAYAIDAPGDEA
jgi:Cft2 family RNA processing exonuclease